ncbi:hypothetical protein BSL78_23380 [Apostichopus japonicus]|uniref:Glutaredoxin-2, mitochondrial n=1 Tax=Stichopus japonicus TaxID=307972 RepID=A0A2G8JVN0_STIJA|nr:hypothetical protein BSL78_23380 [Apostichopus japonicus]
MASAARQLVKELITKNKVMVFSKSYCPFCMQAKSVLRQAGVQDMGVMELEQRSDGNTIQSIVKEMTGNSTVPSVFIDHKFVGGSSDVQDKFDSGELSRLLQQLGIVKQDA